eukprot:scaffold7207_cov62-Phaeocystis_antarctica.AAC.15
MPVAAGTTAALRLHASRTSDSTPPASPIAACPSAPAATCSKMDSACRCTASWLLCSSCTHGPTPPASTALLPASQATSSSSAAAAACATSPPPSRRTASISTSAPPAAATASLCGAHDSAASTRHASRLPCASRPLTWAVATRAATPPHTMIAFRACTNFATCRRLPAAACCSARPPPSCDTSRQTAAELATAACAPSSPPVASLCSSAEAKSRASPSTPHARLTMCVKPAPAKAA